MPRKKMQVTSLLAAAMIGLPAILTAQSAAGQ